LLVLVDAQNVDFKEEDNMKKTQKFPVRKAKYVSDSLVLTIPSQLAKAHDINDGDDIEIYVKELDAIRIRKLKR